MTDLHEPTIIVGAGPIGLACAISAKYRGLDPLVIDSGAICESIVRYPIGMTFFTTPERLEIGGHPLVCSASKPTREEAMKYYRGVVRAEQLRVRTYVRLMGAARKADGIHCNLQTRYGPHTIVTDKLVLATGYFDHPNLLGVPGEELPHVSHYFHEAHSDHGLHIVVIGGKNSAVEAALDLFRAGAHVTLVYRGTEFSRSVKYWLKPDIENRIKANEITARFGVDVTSIDRDHVSVRNRAGEEERIRADGVYALTGFHPDFDLMRSIGIRLDDDGRPDINEETFETNVEGVFVAGSITRGRNISNVFIENGRFDGEKIFGDSASREQAKRLYGAINRYYGE